jgi:hypothetical protein
LASHPATAAAAAAAVSPLSAAASSGGEWPTAYAYPVLSTAAAGAATGAAAAAELGGDAGGGGGGGAGGGTVAVQWLQERMAAGYVAGTDPIPLTTLSAPVGGPLASLRKQKEQACYTLFKKQPISMAVISIYL